MRNEFNDLTMSGKSIVMSSLLAIIIICIGFNILMTLALWFLINILVIALYGND